MSSNLPTNVRKLKNISIAASILIGISTTFEFSPEEIRARISPIHSDLKIVDEEIVFSPEIMPCTLISEKISSENTGEESYYVIKNEEDDGLIGDTIPDKIYNYLISRGLTNEGAAGLMGNLKAESNLIPYRLQGDYKIGYERSKEYTKKVDSGEISKSDFEYKGPGGGGYGLAQWTFHARKTGLYDYAKSKDKSIGDLKTQLEYMMFELEGRPEIIETLKTSHNIKETTSIVLYKYERPAKPNLSIRLRLAKQFLK